MAEKHIKDAATVLGGSAMLVKIGSINFAAKEIKYHHSCYINAADHKVESKSSTEYAEMRPW